MRKLHFDFENMGGLLSVYAIPVTSFVCTRKDYLTHLNYIEYTNSQNIIEIPVYADSTFYFNEDHTAGDAGDEYNVAVGGVIPKIMMENADDIEKLERGEWLVLHQDINGTVHLSGDKNVQMKFTTQKTTGSAAADRNQIAFTFSCIQENPSVIIAIKDLTVL